MCPNKPEFGSGMNHCLSNGTLSSYELAEVEVKGHEWKSQCYFCLDALLSTLYTSHVPLLEIVFPYGYGREAVGKGRAFQMCARCYVFRIQWTNRRNKFAEVYAPLRERKHFQVLKLCQIKERTENVRKPVALVNDPRVLQSLLMGRTAQLISDD